MLLTQIITLFFASALIGLFAVVYRHILAYEPVLNWWFKFGSRFESKWFHKPIWGCELCIAGQLALWSYLLNVLSIVIFNGNSILSDFLLFIVPNYHLKDFSLLEGFIFICEAIAFAFIIYKGYNKLSN